MTQTALCSLLITPLHYLAPTIDASNPRGAARQRWRPCHLHYSLNYCLPLRDEKMPLEMRPS
jgi:hypothetical protein